MSTKSVLNQPAPISGGQPILPLVISDLNERAEVGIQRYGSLLSSNNGRDSLTDAYQEALDLVMYLRQALFERDQE